MTISAIIPVHNGAALVGEAIRSVRAQRPPVHELIVVDDGSEDGTAAAVRQTDPEVRLLRQARRGPAGARNHGAAVANGDLLAFLDHDDLWPPGRNAALLAGLAADPSAGMVCGRLRIEEMPGAVPDPRLRMADGAQVPFLLGSALIRLPTWHALGGLRAVHDRAEDLDFYLRLREAEVPVAMVDAPALTYRMHGGNRSRAALGPAAMLAAMRAAVLRRQGAPT
nr:glycosyltransferase family A protein [Pararoseomonas indoligenes]